MFGRNLVLFEIFGFKVQVNVTWVFVALLIALSLALGFFPEFYGGLPPVTYWWMAIAAVIGLFFSIVLHELAHSLVARRFGMQMRGITLFMFGGVSEMEQEPPSPKAEFVMAVAGPIASLLLAALFYGAAAGAASLGMPEALRGVLSYLALLNIVLAIFNLVPAFPLDGGRALRAALWWWHGNQRRATRVAAAIGAAFGFLLMALGVLNVVGGNFVGGVWWFLMGMFLRAAAVGSFRQLEMRRMLQGEPVRRFMTANPITVPAATTVRDLVDDYIYVHHHKVFPVTDGDRLLGAVDLNEVKAVPRDRWELVQASAILTPLSPDIAIDAEEDAVKALSRMQRTGSTWLLVTTGDGRLAGIVSLKDILQLLALRMDLEEDADSLGRNSSRRGRGDRKGDA
ncbi:MAG TPA: site-2 protease family protein [Alphaproteobacteria bacterium]|jgi:Zn-dependent protease|nr:site-2 protease family protein [Alphaproteobacteria bacterium]